jgi:hypothetical protein
MLVRREHNYESGAFDVRAVAPRPTAIATAIASLARHGTFDHPVLDRLGWWRPEPRPPAAARAILLSGWGRLASIIEECCASRRLTIRPASPGHVLTPGSLNGAWAAISIQEHASSHRTAQLRCLYADGNQAFLRFSATLPLLAVANAFVDFMVDGGRGTYELQRAAIGNQYELIEREAKHSETDRGGYSHVA